MVEWISKKDRNGNVRHIPIRNVPRGRSDGSTADRLIQVGKIEAELKLLKKKEERRLEERALIEIEKILVEPFSSLFSPFIGMIVEVFLFRREQKTDKEIIEEIDRIDRAVEVAEYVSSMVSIHRSETEKTHSFLYKIREGVKRSMGNGRSRIGEILKPSIKAYADEILSKERLSDEYRIRFHNDINISNPVRDLAKTNVKKRIDTAFDCMLSRLVKLENLPEDKVKAGGLATIFLIECIEDQKNNLQQASIEDLGNKSNF